MSAAGFTPIQLYRSTTASAAPTAGNLADGELAINTNDGKLYYKDSGGVVQLIASKAGASGDVVGPASATDNAVVRFDGTTGKLVQNSVVTIADTTGDVAGVGALTASGNVTLSGGTANGVLYLNGSKVATSGSALTFDGTDLTFQSAIKLLNNDGSGNKAVLSSFAYGGSGATGTLTLSSTYGNANQQRIKVGVGGAAATSFEIDSSEGMRLTSTGLGIGTSSPNAGAKLTVAGGILATSSFSSTSGSTAGIDYDSGSLRLFAVGTSGATKGAYSFIAKGADGSSSTPMTLDASGNLVIGDTSGTARLEVKAVGVMGRFKTGAAADGRVEWAYNTTDIGYIGADTSTEFSVFARSGNVLKLGAGGSERARITSGGVLMVGTTGLPAGNGTALSLSGASNVARVYGTTEADAALTVDKSTNTNTSSQVFVQFTINAQATGNGQINGNGASQAAFGSFSDRRLKKNITDLPSQLDNIMALRPVEFDYIESEGGGRQISFIAQEFEQVYPDAVGERTDGMKTLTGWGKTEARLVKAIQEQQALIESLTSRVAQLEGTQP